MKSRRTAIPLYAYQCEKCGSEATMYNSVDNRDKGPKCCMLRMQKIITPATVRADIPAYQSPISGKAITSRKQRMEDLKRSGCREWEGLAAEKAHAASVKASEDAKFDRELTQTAATVLNNMSSEHQKALKAV